MKRLLILAAVAALALSCSEKQPTELYVPKNTVEFAGNAFTDFSLGADVKLYATPNPDNKKQWLVQAVVPVRKETKAKVQDLDIHLTPLDDRGIRVRDGFSMEGEDLEHLVPVYTDGSPNTAHSLNPVPFIYVTNNNSATVKDGRLADVAPSILHIMGLEQPADMTGENLIQDNK